MGTEFRTTLVPIVAESTILIFRCFAQQIVCMTLEAVALKAQICVAGNGCFPDQSIGSLVWATSHKRG